MERVTLDFAQYTDCLRVQIYPDETMTERISSVLQNCLKFGIKNVILFLNAEAFFTGHLTEEELDFWLPSLKSMRNIFWENGISVSLNLWTTIGHCDRGRTLKKGQDFRLMKDINGKSSRVVCCPLDERWRAYYKKIALKLIRELEPDLYWIEDDFRLHNHTPLYYGGCFCKEHLALMNAQLGKELTLDEFRTALYQKGKCTPERKAWLDVKQRKK